MGKRFTYGGRVDNRKPSSSDKCQKCGKLMNMRYSVGNKIVCNVCKRKSLRIV